MIVYHGSISIIPFPDLGRSSRSLDFGRGFYVTADRESAECWARRKALLRNRRTAVLNRYELIERFDGFSVKRLEDDPAEWIRFVSECRNGSIEYLQYDLIIGRSADTGSFSAVALCQEGIWDADRAAKELGPLGNTQYALITRRAVEELLVFRGYSEVT